MVDSIPSATVSSAADIAGVLARAITDKSKFQLQAMIDGKPRAFAARAVKLEGAGDDGFWIHLIESPDSATNALARPRPALSIACCVTRVRYSFQTTIERRERHFWIDDRVMLDALLLATPAELKQLDGRRERRTEVGDGSGISAQLFRFAPWCLPGTKRHQIIPIRAALRDLSARGAGFIGSFDRKLNELRPNQPLGCCIDFRNTKLCLLATLIRVTEISARTMQIAIEFCRPADQGIDGDDLAGLRKVLEELERQQTLRQRVRRAS